MVAKHMKGCSTYYVIREMTCKLKQQWGTTAGLLEWPQSTTLTTHNADEDEEG